MRRSNSDASPLLRLASPHRSPLSRRTRSPASVAISARPAHSSPPTPPPTKAEKRSFVADKSRVRRGATGQASGECEDCRPNSFAAAAGEDESAKGDLEALSVPSETAGRRLGLSVASSTESADVGNGKRAADREAEVLSVPSAGDRTANAR